jgi:hypothetical protein
MPEYYVVTLNGVPLFKGLKSRAEAEQRAERWQGNRYKTGLLKHGDKGDHVEVKRDVCSERDFDARYADAKAGNRQRIIFEEYIPD